MPTPVRIDHLPTLPDELLDGAWRLYTEAFDELRIAAVQRHVMHRGEFDDVMADKRVTKFAVFDPAAGDAMCGLGTRTDDLDAVPLISPDFFAARYPVHYAERRIFYIGFLAVHPDYHGTGVFIDLIHDMSAGISAVGGIAAMDVCRINNANYRLPHAVLRLTRTYSPDVRITSLDEQTYWAYEFPSVE